METVFKKTANESGKVRDAIVVVLPARVAFRFPSSAAECDRLRCTAGFANGAATREPGFPCMKWGNRVSMECA